MNENLHSQFAAWRNYGMVPLITADGSPSLRQAENMHHSGGAWTETQYIYGALLEQGLARFHEIKALVVGLGLGYIEGMIFERLRKEASLRNSLTLISYESLPFLREAFLQSYALKPALEEAPVIPAECLSLMDQVRRILTQDEAKLLAFVREVWLKNKFQLHESLEGNLPQRKSNLIFFDAYSAKSSPELWSESFLDEFLRVACEEQCGFSTYACTGVLKRTLKKHGFELEIRQGFQGKRQSTMAFRGL